MEKIFYADSNAPDENVIFVPTCEHYSQKSENKLRLTLNNHPPSEVLKLLQKRVNRYG
jgi:hypothetical protein